MKISKSKTNIISLKSFIFSLLSLLSLSLVTSCDTTEPKSHRIILNEKSVASTEVWLELNVEGFTLPQKVELIRNGKAIRNIVATKRNTIVFDDNLKPLTNYDYVAKLSERLFIADVSQIRTLDTTSHDFTWEIFYFGNGIGNSVLEDVEIIDDNNIWVVGDIQDAGFDKDGVWQDQHNVVRWNGSEWQTDRIFGDSFCNPDNKYTPYLHSIYIDPKNHIWTNSGSQVINVKDGKIYCSENISRLDKLEGFNDGSIIAVNHTNEKSLLNYFKSGTWEKIELPNEGFIMDLLPIVERNGEKSILFPHSNYKTKMFELLIINSQKKVKQYSTLPYYTSSVWTKNGLPLYGCGDKLFENKNGEWNLISEHSVSKINGSELNNIFAVGWGNILHFNGSTWKRYEEFDGIYYAVAVSSNAVVIVGMHDNKAVIVVGRKN